MNIISCLSKREEANMASPNIDLSQKANPNSNKRRKIKDRVWRGIFIASGIISALMIVVIIIFVSAKGVSPFLPNYENVRQNVGKFLTGMTWRPDVGEGIYGVAFIIVNTLVSALIAAAISFPIAVLTALFIVKIAPKRLREPMQIVVELLAAIPSVVYGVFAASKITTLVESVAGFFGVSTFGGKSLMSVSLLLAIMIFPTITSMSINAISAVDKNLELGSLALGASRTQTNFKVVLTSAKSGIFAGLVLGLGRAFGEATAVSMVAGNSQIGINLNPFAPTRTLTSTMLSGLKETTGVDYDIRFSVGIVLMVIILVTNLLIQIMKRKIGGGINAK